jgi:hypothetical protein
MYTDFQLEVLVGLLKRREDKEVSDQDYEDLLTLAESELSWRKNVRRKQKIHAARQAAVDAPFIANDPAEW